MPNEEEDFKYILRVSMEIEARKRNMLSFFKNISEKISKNEKLLNSENFNVICIKFTFENKD